MSQKDYPIFIPEGTKNYHYRYYDPEKHYSRSKSLRTSDYKKACKEYDKVKAKKILNIKEDDGLFSKPPRRHTLSSAFDEFKLSRYIKPKSITGYHTAVNEFIKATGDKVLIYYTVEDYRRFMAYLKRKTSLRHGEVKPVSRNTIANYTVHLHTFFNWLVKNQLIRENIITKIRFVYSDPKPLSEDIKQAIFKKIIDINPFERRFVIKQRFEYYNFFNIMYLAALRLNEAVQIRIEDFDVKNEVVFIRNSKGNRTDMIPMPDDLREYFIKMDKPETGRMFPTITYNSANRFWVRMQHRFNINYTTHQFRATRGTDLANQGVKPIFLQKFMRHKNFETTLRHYVLVETNKAKADINATLPKTSLDTSLEFRALKDRIGKLEERAEKKKASNRKI
jgi:integrase